MTGLRISNAAGRIGDAEKSHVWRRERVVAAEVGAGAERRACAGQHDCPHGVVGIAGLIRLAEEAAHLGGVRVALLGSVQCQNRYTLRNLNGEIRRSCFCGGA